MFPQVAHDIGQKARDEHTSILNELTSMRDAIQAKANASNTWHKTNVWFKVLVIRIKIAWTNVRLQGGCYASATSPSNLRSSVAIIFSELICCP